MEQKKINFWFVCMLIFLLFAFAPNVFAEEIAIKFDTEENNLGFIYFDYNPTLYATIINGEENEKNIVLAVAAEDENGNTVWSDEYNFTIPRYKAMNIPIQTEIERFGLYTLIVTVGEVRLEQEFSIANRPRDGSVSQWSMLNDHTIKGHGIKQSERKMELFYKAGFGGIRQEYLWEGFEPVLDSFTVPSATTGMIRLMDKHHMDIMGIMMGCPKYISEWGNGKLPVEDETLAEWSKYVEYTAEQTKGISTYYEIWNEYNMRDGATPENYIKLLKASYAPLHKNPNAIVCGFAAANIGAEQTEYAYSALEWIEKVLQGGGGEYMDAVSIHCYTNRAPEDDLSDLESGKTWLIDETRNLLDCYGYTDMPIIVSEMGWSTGNTGHTELEKAQYMIRYAAMNYGKVERLYWYVSQDKQNVDADGNPDLYENGLGILHTWDEATGCKTPYGAKPAFLALANFNAMMNEATEPQKSITDEDVYQYKFKDRYDNDLYIVWSTQNQDTSIEIEGNGKCVSVYDLYGNIVKCATNESTVAVALSESPVYIRLTEKEEDIAEYRPEISVDYNTGEVVIAGATARSCQSVALSVIKKETDIILPTDIAYIGQSETDVNGNYRFQFRMCDAKELYVVKIGVMDAEKTQQTETVFDLAIPTFSVLANGKTVNKITQLTDGDEIVITFQGIRNLCKEDKTILIAAMYKSEKLVDLKMEEINSGSKEAELKVKVNDTWKVDKIRVFFWEQGEVQPLMGVYEIN